MSGFDLPNNYIDNPEALLRKGRSRTASSSATPLAVEPVTPVPSATSAMAKTLRNYSTPAIANGYWKLRALNWPDYDGVGKLVLWLAKQGCKCTLATLP